jgi:hypothetical protein
MAVQMTPRRRRAQRIKPDRRRPLELLVTSRDGCTDSILLAHGFSIPQMVELVRAGLATATAERVAAGSRKPVFLPKFTGGILMPIGAQAARQAEGPDDRFPTGRGAKMGA